MLPRSSAKSGTKNLKSTNPKGSLLRQRRTGSGGQKGRGLGEFRSPYKFSSKKVRTSIKKHRQESHFEKSRLEASAQSASAWYFPAILKAFLKSHASVRSAMRKFLCESTEKTKFSEPIFFLSLSAKG